MKLARLATASMLVALFVAGTQSPASARKKNKVQVLKNVKIKENKVLSGNCVSVLSAPCP